MHITSRAFTLNTVEFFDGSTTTNIFNLVSGDFWDLEVGDNTINIAMVGTTAASRVTVAHYNRYLVA